MIRSKVLLFLSFLVLSCSKHHIEVQGHRGCRGLLPENSLPGFEKAVTLGVDVLELDVVITKDHVVLVSHEAFLHHKICYLANGESISAEHEQEYNLYEMTFEEIQQYDCGSKFHPEFPNQMNQMVTKPSLNAVFQLVEQQNPAIKYNIELKSKLATDHIYHPNPETFVALVIKVLEQYGVEQRTVLQSFDIRILEEIHKRKSDLAIALLVDKNETISEKLKSLSFQPEIISPEFSLLNEAMVKMYQEKGFQIIPWTVNAQQDLQEMIGYGVDAIITDYPDVLLNMLDQTHQ